MESLVSAVCMCVCLWVWIQEARWHDMSGDALSAAQRFDCMFRPFWLCFRLQGHTQQSMAVDQVQTHCHPDLVESSG